MKHVHTLSHVNPFPSFARSLSSLGIPFVGHLINVQDLATVDYVDLERFMGAWRVQGHTPLLIDDDSTDQIETYVLNDEGKIDVTYQFTRYGKVFTMHPTAEIIDKDSNARWKMTFFGVFPNDYLIVRLAEDYSYTVVSVPSKKMIWIMSRMIHMSEIQFNEILQTLKSDDYPIEQIRRVSHKAQFM